MALEGYNQKPSVVVVYTGDGKGKTSAGLGMTVRALGAGFKVAFVQFIKEWETSEHKFIREITPIYKDQLFFFKGGRGFYNAGELSSKASEAEHKESAIKTYQIAYDAVTSGDYDLVVCDEINNAVADGLLSIDDLKKIIMDKKETTNLCLTGRNFPDELVDIVDIATNMHKIKHHFDNKLLANKGIDY